MHILIQILLFSFAGNMWAQSWKNIIDLVLPFQGKRRIDLTAEMLRQGYTAHRWLMMYFISTI